MFVFLFILSPLRNAIKTFFSEVKVKGGEKKGRKKEKPRYFAFDFRMWVLENMNSSGLCLYLVMGHRIINISIQNNRYK